ncbi:cisplatin damage response ATP-dependent DNA ligase [Alteromonas halophila]|uniref:DNA ligase (ATP) n=1 Tax=Alteromonas halophila TaxID=516698 RepID=A0A918JLG1_9ALTE|nr:cisplatin damage response ATP-dependent DNA ligase [Alteromonas halophila]GGW83448.1 ATP-dependent DNA ligase [Alteromonas halophila]
MNAFSDLLEQLYFTGSTNTKAAILKHYIATTPDPDRGWAIAAIAGTLRFDFFKRNTVKKLMLERVDEALFAMSYDYVGEMSETVAHLWPEPATAQSAALPSLSEVVETFRSAKRNEVSGHLQRYLDMMTAAQRWALIKLGTRGLRIGMSARSVKQVLAEYGDKDIQEIEALWHAMMPPYTTLLAYLEGRADKPDISDSVTFHPVMLAHPIDDRVLDNWQPADWQVEHKFDGIRVQLVVTAKGKALFSRTGDDISHAFPDLTDSVDRHMVVDGELLVIHGDKQGMPQVDTFNALQQRLNKKKPAPSLIKSLPAGMIVYDAMSLDGQSLTELPLSQRRTRLEKWFSSVALPRLYLSRTLQADSTAALRQLHEHASQDLAVEGLMIKRKAGQYIPGRPKGEWYKWKRDPLYVDAVVMYAQRGHGNRSSYYSDFTFGAWQGDTLLPIGKAYSGFTDEELKKLDNWVRRHAIGRFGPVREVEKALVVEVAFDAVHPSKRHKSGVALRFPRIHRIRWDKPAAEADTLDIVKSLIERAE